MICRLLQIAHYCSQADVLAIEKWMYNVPNLHDAYMERKYARFQFTKHVLMNKSSISVVERSEKMREFREMERQTSQNTIDELIKMCRKQIPCPTHFRFAPSFVKKVTN